MPALNNGVAEPGRQRAAFQADQLSSTVPAGAMTAYAAASAPSGWLLCNGAAVSRSTYSDLYGVVGDTYGNGNGSTTFNVPDIRRRAVVGSGGTASTVLGNALGDTGGEEDHTLTVGRDAET